MALRNPQAGQRIQVTRLLPITNLLVERQHLAARRPHTTGLLLGPVPGHAIDIWWVHDDATGRIAPYHVDELELFQQEPRKEA